MALTSDRLLEIVRELATRPGHEKVRTLVFVLLTDGLGATSTEIEFERQMPEVHGRSDALLGRTVFELKSDLRRETKDAEEELTRYLGDREAAMGERYIGIATDGATFVPYELRRGKLRRLSEHRTSVKEPRALLDWLSATVAVSEGLEPEPEMVRRELGRASVAWLRARGDLGEMWAEVGGNTDVRLKRDLWAQMLEQVYGTSVDSDDLFFQHTYLTVVAKTIAVHVLGMDMPEPAALLSGKPFEDIGITGAVESDFFDWLLKAAAGPDLVGRIARTAARFKLRDVQTDVLKGLYESLIDPETRHELGEYYTPDWLAQRMCERAIDRPLGQRVLDPACGSGTFLFHAVRRFLAAADAAGMGNEEALERCCGQVLGIDAHPVAAQIARVTYLLALGEERLQDRPSSLAVPVYLGDSLQWNTRYWMGRRDVEIKVPEGGPNLEFPFAVAQDPGAFDVIVGRMLTLSEQGAAAESLRNWLSREYALTVSEVSVLMATYDALCQLRREDRDHVWGFVARNLARPAWLSREDERADVIVGNPPWLSYRYMSPKNQKIFRERCQERGIWAGGKVATHQDLSAYFFARCIELYFKPESVIAFVMPYAAMSRRQFEGFRKGVYGKQGKKEAAGQITFVRFTEAWAFPDDVQPLFPVPSCVLFARQRRMDVTEDVLPGTVRVWSGRLPERDASPDEADKCLTSQEAPWPAVSDEEGGSPYRAAFRNGATIFPRMLCVVERADVGPLGANPAAPVVQSRRTSQEKPPWKYLEPLKMPVEAQFLRPLYLGESIAPFRLLKPVQAVIPWDETANQLLDSAAAQRAGHQRLGQWLWTAERLWAEHGRSGMSFLEQIDYYGKLSAQLPPAPLRVVYGKSGTIMAAAVLTDTNAIVENTAYWSVAATEAEARYLCAILNSETTRMSAEHLQARGQWGARHFDKVMFELPIPKFDASNPLHRRLAEAAARAEEIAAAVPLKEGEHFVRTRGRIREALRADGVAGRIDTLVAELLGPA